MKSFLTVGLALAACAALADVEKQTFDGSEIGTTLPAGFAGDGTIELKTEGDTDKVLAVDGTVTCSNTGDAAQWGKTTFLVKAPEDATATADLPTANDIGENCQIAVATGSADGDNLKVMVYRGKQGEETNPVWEETNVTVAKGAWFTVVLDFDYSVSKVQVLVNNTSAGWFPLVTKQAMTSKIASLSFVGSTKVDDVSIAEVDNVPVEALPAAIKGLDKINLAAQGVTLAQIVENAKVGSSDLTVQEKIESGLNPTDNSTFTATALAPADEGKLAITVPCAFDNGQAYTIVVTDATGSKEVVAEAGDIDNGKRTLTFMPQTTGNVLKFQVKASAPTAPTAQ